MKFQRGNWYVLKNKQEQMSTDALGIFFPSVFNLKTATLSASLSQNSVYTDAHFENESTKLKKYF